MTASEFPPAAGGISWGVYRISKKLTERGHRVTVVTRGSPEGMTKEYCDGVTVYRLPYLHVYPIHVKIHQLFQNRLLKDLQSEFDLFHVHHPLTPPFRTSLPIVLTVHTSLSLSKSAEMQNFHTAGKLPDLILDSMRWYFGRIERQMLENAKRVTVVSNVIADELKMRYGRLIAQKPIDVIGYGVDTSLFTPGTGSTTSILYAGRLAWNKGLFDFVRSAKLILEKRPDALFVLTGDGPIANDLKDLVKSLGIDHRFFFRGYLPRAELIKCYQMASVFVLPAYYEGLPTSLLEAMACGVPPVTTKVGSIPEVVQNQRNGVLLQKADPRAIADGVVGLLQDETVRRRLGQAARKTVVDRYNLKQAIDRIEKCYTLAIESGRFN
jgi:glycosyltransferase involved in cell wall biosynthesis